MRKIAIFTRSSNLLCRSAPDWHIHMLRPMLIRLYSLLKLWVSRAQYLVRATSRRWKTWLGSGGSTKTKWQEADFPNCWMDWGHRTYNIINYRSYPRGRSSTWAIATPSTKGLWWNELVFHSHWGKTRKQNTYKQADLQYTHWRRHKRANDGLNIRDELGMFRSVTAIAHWRCARPWSKPKRKTHILGLPD